MRVVDRLREIYEETAGLYDTTVGKARLPHFLTLGRMMQFRGTEHVLDLGCGPGNLTREVEPYVASVAGLDASPAMVEEARRRRPTLAWHVGDATRTGLPEGSLDGVVSSQLLPWLPSPDAFFGEVRRLLRPGGLFGLITSASSTYREFFQALDRLLRTYEEYYQTDSVSQVWGSRTYTVGQLERLLDAAGFRIQSWVVLQTEVATTAAEYLELMRMFTGDHYLYPLPEERRPRAKAELTELLRREGLTLNERSVILVARRE
jgi:ubiquinone/menaquinone biosynthesis C-methylase UbiE